MSLRNIAWACREDTIFSHVLLAHPSVPDCRNISMPKRSHPVGSHRAGSPGTMTERGDPDSVSAGRQTEETCCYEPARLRRLP